MSEVNYRRNGMKYSTGGKCWGLAPKAGGGRGALGDRPLPGDAERIPRPRPKSSWERRAMKKVE